MTYKYIFPWESLFLEYSKDCSAGGKWKDVFLTDPVITGHGLIISL